MLLVHLTATQQQSQRTASEPMFGGLPESLAMEMVANGLFHSGEQPDVLLARTRMLWETYGSQIDLERLKVRARPLDLLKEATGLDFERHRGAELRLPRVHPRVPARPVTRRQRLRGDRGEPRNR